MNHIPGIYFPYIAPKGCKEADMIINIAHTKGGVGKSTITTNLAVEMNLPVIDMDFQESSIFFNRLRSRAGLPPIQVVRINNDIEELKKVLVQYKGKKDKHILIDSPGMDNDILRLALLSSDIIITPIFLTMISLGGFQQFANALKEIGVFDKGNEYVLFNNYNPRGKNDREAMAETITKQMGTKILPSGIASRKVFETAYAEGMSVREKEERDIKDPSARKATQDIQNVIRDIRNIIDNM